MLFHKLLTNAMTSAALGVALSTTNVYAQSVEAPATPTTSQSTVAIQNAPRPTDCTISKRTIMGALFGSAAKGLGNKIGIDGLGRAAGTIAQESVSPECVKEPTARTDRYNILGQ